jgi:transcriptional regulator of arginine metabolism
MNKSYRQSRILKLIRTRHVHTQEELARALAGAEDSGNAVTLSRDIRELGLVKTPDGYAAVDADAPPVPSGPDVAAVAREFPARCAAAQNLLVLRTPPAHATRPPPRSIKRIGRRCGHHRR